MTFVQCLSVRTIADKSVRKAENSFDERLASDSHADAIERRLADSRFRIVVALLVRIDIVPFGRLFDARHKFQQFDHYDKGVGN